MVRTVGHKVAGNFVMDPQAAWQRGRSLDALLRSVDVPRWRGVTRGDHATLNVLDDARAVERARRVDDAPRAKP